MSAEKRQPWLKWYPSDWRAEPRLRMVSRAARSLWLDMIGLMHEAEPYGFLIVANISLKTAADIARALGDAEAEIAPLLIELNRSGVYSRAGDANLPADVAALISEGIDAGTILSRKMVRDKARADKNLANGCKGGNPCLKQGGLTDGLSQGDNAQKPESRSQSSVLRTAAKVADGKSPNGSTPPSKPSDNKTWLFREGLTWLKKSSARPEKGLRSQLGRWLRDVKDDTAALRAILEAAQEQAVAEPIAWIAAAILTRAKAVAPFEPTDEYGWRQRFKAYRDTCAWPAKWGGTRPGEDPRHPAYLLAECGYTAGSTATDMEGE